MQLGEKIYTLRSRAGYSQENFAEALGVSRQSVSRWENDIAVPDTEYLVKISRLLGASLDELLLAEELPPIEEKALISEREAQERAPRKNLIIKRVFLAVLAGVLLCAGIFLIVDAVLVFERGAVPPEGTVFEDWLFSLVRLQDQNELLFDLGGALFFLRFIPALALFDFLFCLGEKKWSHAMLGVTIALFVLLALSLAAEPLLLYARRTLFEGDLSAEAARTPVAVITACRLLVLCCMTGLAAAYIAIKHRYCKR